MNKSLFLIIALSAVNILVGAEGGNVGIGSGVGDMPGCSQIKKHIYAMLIPSATEASDWRNGSGLETSDFSAVFKELERVSNFSK